MTDGETAGVVLGSFGALISVVSLVIGWRAHVKVDQIKRLDLSLELQRLQNQLRSEYRVLFAAHEPAWRKQQQMQSARGTLGSSRSKLVEEEWKADNKMLNDPNSLLNTEYAIAVAEHSEAKPADLVDRIAQVDSTLHTVQELLEKYRGWDLQLKEQSEQMHRERVASPPDRGSSFQ